MNDLWTQGSLNKVQYCRDDQQVNFAQSRNSSIVELRALRITAPAVRIQLTWGLSFLPTHSPSVRPHYVIACVWMRFSVSPVTTQVHLAVPVRIRTETSHSRSFGILAEQPACMHRGGGAFVRVDQEPIPRGNTMSAFHSEPVKATLCWWIDLTWRRVFRDNIHQRTHLPTTSSTTECMGLRRWVRKRVRPSSLSKLILQLCCPSVPSFMELKIAQVGKWVCFQFQLHV